VHAIMDTIWPLGFVLIAVVGVGLRLGAHIYLRNRGQGEDRRYASLPVQMAMHSRAGTWRAPRALPACPARNLAAYGGVGRKP